MVIQILWISFTHSKKTSEHGCHRSTLGETLRYLKIKNVFIPESGNRHLVIYLDGLRVNKKTYLITSNCKHVIGFCLVNYESSNNWRNFIKNFNEPEYVVCDGQNGLIQKYKDVYFMCEQTLNKS